MKKPKIAIAILILFATINSMAAKVNCSVESTIGTPSYVKYSGDLPLLIESGGINYTMSEIAPQSDNGRFSLGVAQGNGMNIGIISYLNEIDHEAMLRISIPNLSGSNDYSIMSCKLIEKTALLSEPDQLWINSVKIQEARMKADGSMALKISTGSCGENSRFRLQKGYSDNSRIFLHLIFESNRKGCGESANFRKLNFSKDEILSILGSDVGKIINITDSELSKIHQL